MNNEGNIKLVVDAVLICGDKVLLVRYKDTNKYDHQKGWFLPDDLINHGEHPDDAALRIMHEQLGCKGAISAALDHVESFTGNDKSWHLVFHYLSDLSVVCDINPSDDIDEAKWFNINELPDSKEIAHHGWAKFTIDKIISNLNKME